MYEFKIHKGNEEIVITTRTMKVLREFIITNSFEQELKNTIEEYLYDIEPNIDNISNYDKDMIIDTVIEESCCYFSVVLGRSTETDERTYEVILQRDENNAYHSMRKIDLKDILKGEENDNK